ncbi:unnamed protein product [Rotaria magnacalcarata]|uniref:Uncharacterized protein n=2 Tax=Rotaria magnacalcarata TaxID=392030 RepID=A0A816CMQ1_9BILA|nr:unnamed protein product [Rotaria magnacalcarata]CAF1936350.1 unnamed protein product [Rotaria magnacalcarata]CAF2089842.1 unnamed protein product [Rotaria magnacalcarata]CAF2141215.1 unnamed protein product [Rotaria magnacalcarata]CAF3853584.1 unnamed protein product [Rotaria magnacalcarata]
MLLSASHSALIVIVVVTTVLFLVAYCTRSNQAHRHIAPLPMQVVVLTQPRHNELQQQQMCWSIPIEQPPPPYHTVVARMNDNSNFVFANNAS